MKRSGQLNTKKPGNVNFNINALRSRADRLRSSNPKLPEYKSRRPDSEVFKSLPSLIDSFFDTSAKPRQVYTGNVIKGVGVLHKSNLVPISSQEEAIEIARMRR